MKSCITLTFILLLLSSCRASDVTITKDSILNARLIDDSYTVSQRYDKYRQKDEKISIPELVFQRGQRVIFDLRYHKIGHRELHVDVFLPPLERNNHRAAILVHGGGWRSGNKSHLYPLANQLAQAGYAVAIPEYRLSTEREYPAALVDINHAIVWLKQKAHEYLINPEQLILVGASSGGQMAALVANTANNSLFKEELRYADTSVAGLVVLDGVLDFEHPDTLPFESRGADTPASVWLGGEYGDIPHIWRQASAINYLDKNSPPTLLIGSGQKRFTGGREQFCERLSNFGIAIEFHAFDGIIHTFWLFEPYVIEVTSKINRFSERLFRNETH